MSKMTLHLTRVLMFLWLCAIAAPWIGAAHAHGVTLKIHHAQPEDSAFHSRFLLPWKEKLEKESNGYLRIQVFPTLATSDKPALYEQVKDRNADIVWASIAEGTRRFPGFEVFNLPLPTHSAKGSSRALWEYVQANNLARREFSGVRLLAVQLAPKPLARRDSSSASTQSDLFVLVMNAETYRSLSEEIKRVITANSGADTSALLGKLFDDSQTVLPEQKTETSATAVAQTAIEQRIQELNQRGLEGKELLESARALLAQFDPPH
jgi:TRAP-type C4-dicarboxylate transport system substrate-binding protein